MGKAIRDIYGETLAALGAEREDIVSCIECGSCQFTCPAHRPLLDNIRQGKSTVMGIIRARAAKK